jgi:hypothetical protein
MTQIKGVLLMRQYATSFSNENIKQNLKDSTKNSSGAHLEFN